jgi:hypothetical protein
MLRDASSRRGIFRIASIAARSSCADARAASISCAILAVTRGRRLASRLLHLAV